MADEQWMKYAPHEGSSPTLRDGVPTRANSEPRGAHVDVGSAAETAQVSHMRTNFGPGSTQLKDMRAVDSS